MGKTGFEDWRPLILIGDVQLLEQEGGFCGAQIWIRSRALDSDGMEAINTSLDAAIYKWAHGEDMQREGCVDDDKITQGFLRITIERLE